MPGVRLDRVLASTAIALLLAAAPALVHAGPMSEGDIGAAPAEPNTASGPQAPAASMEPEPAAGVVQESPDGVITSGPAPTANTDEWTGQPVEPSAATVTSPAATPNSNQSRETSDVAAPAAGTTPVSTPAADESAGQPAAAAPIAAPPQANETSQVPSAPGENTVPPTAAVTPAVTSPSDATAKQPTAMAAPSALAEADAAIAEQLRDLARGKFDRIIGSKKDRAAIDTFYSGRGFAPLWISDGKVTARAQAVIAYLGQVDSDGLDPADYPVPVDFASLSDPAALAEAEIRLTGSVIAYARHAQIGRVHWSRVSADIFYEQKPPDPADALANMAEAEDVGAALAAYQPQSAGYLALKAKLAEFRAGKGDAGKAAIANGPALKIGMQDARVPRLRERLGVAGDGTTYDKAIADAVRKFQEEHELKPTGLLTPATVEALNGRRPDRPTDIILANMERWRWMPHDLGKNYVIVNLADFTLRVANDGKQVWMTKIVDGKPTMATPIMSAEMKYITVNPTWNVPPSIVANEYLPALQQDPTVLARMGLRVSYNRDGSVHISQPPGDRNALGRLRFNFPNKFLVYQHDTPDKHLFAFERRAFSHGCMRVQDPVKYAEVLLSIVRPGQGYTQDRIRKMFGSGETDISFPSFIPVHLTYQTAFVDDDGKLQFRDDVYGRDKMLVAMLKGDERKVADIAVERRENIIRRQVLAIPEQAAWGGQNFFARLFGLPAFGAPPVPRRPVAQRRTETRWPREE